jgi:hypothetical protein
MTIRESEAKFKLGPVEIGHKPKEGTEKDRGEIIPIEGESLFIEVAHQDALYLRWQYNGGGRSRGLRESQINADPIAKRFVYWTE